jgi:hypothetical protein
MDATQHSCEGHRIVTYNLLSQADDLQTYYGWCDASCLEAETRKERIKVKLKTEMDANAIIGLQEVATDFSTELRAFFEKNGYRFIVGLWHPRLGVAVAVPIKYDIVRQVRERAHTAQLLTSNVADADGYKPSVVPRALAKPTTHKAFLEGTASPGKHASGRLALPSV